MPVVSDELREEVFDKFRGINRRSDRLNSNKEFAFDILNGHILKDARSDVGVIQQREGTSKLNAVELDSDYGSTKLIKTLFEAKWNGGGTDLIIRAGTAWGRFDGTDTFDSILTGRADDVKGQALMFKDEVIMLDGGVPQKLTSAYVVSNLSSDANMPQDATAGWVHRDKLWLNSAANPLIAYFSKTNSANGATSWTGTTDAGFLDLSTVLPVGDTIIGFRTFAGEDSGLIAIICKQYTVIYQAGANPYDYTFIQYFPTTCLSIDGAEYIGKDVVYPSRDKLTSLVQAQQTDNLSIKSLSDFIAPLYRTLASQVGDPSLISATFDRKLNFYYITFPITNNFQTLVYSVDIGNFVGRYTFPYNPYSWVDRINGDILFGSDGYVYKLNDGTDDDGTAISWKFAMPAIYFGTPSRYKKPIAFEALVQATKTLTLNIDYWFGLDVLSSDKVTESITISTNTSSLWDEALWDVSYWDTQGNDIVSTCDLLGRGRMMFLELRHNTADARITIPWFIIKYVMEGVN